MDHATSTDPAVQRQLDRLFAAGPGADVLGLSRITLLLDRLGNPQHALPPAFHVAGTNGKGSTCAFLRAALEADGRRVHVFTSPHLVRFNERIRIAGELIGDAALAALLAEVLDAGDGIGASFFEVTTAAAFLAFAQVSADACIIEVGLGGRLDATNVLTDPAACAIAQLGVDHEAFLGSDPIVIGAEKAGIAKPGRPLVTLAYPGDVADSVAAVAERANAPLHVQDCDWRFDVSANGLRLADRRGEILLPIPTLSGAHQRTNYALAAATLRVQDRVPITDDALQAAATAARWPARMQRLSPGPLTARLPVSTELWLDGGHNRAAADAISNAIATHAAGRPIDLVLGMLANKDATGLIAPFVPHVRSLTAVPVPGHEHHAPAELARIAAAGGIAQTATATGVAHALDQKVPEIDEEPAVILILGSLYLAGEVLRENNELPV